MLTTFYKQRLAIITMACLIFSLLFCLGTTPNAKAAENTQIDFNGLSAKLNAAKGKVVVLNFFATWCPPCIEEMPTMQKLYKKYSNDKLEFIAISVDEDPEEVKEVLSKLGVSFPFLVCNGELAEKLQLTAIPRTFVYDRSGKLAHDIEGMVDEKEFNTQVGNLIGK